jgi:hypothetical protein
MVDPMGVCAVMWACDAGTIDIPSFVRGEDGRLAMNPQLVETGQQPY